MIRHEKRGVALIIAGVLSLILSLVLLAAAPETEYHEFLQGLFVGLAVTLVAGGLYQRMNVRQVRHR